MLHKGRLSCGPHLPGRRIGLTTSPFYQCHNSEVLHWGWHAVLFPFLGLAANVHGACQPADRLSLPLAACSGCQRLDMRFNGRFAYSSGVAWYVPPRRRQPAGHPKGPTQEHPRGAIDDQSHRSCGDGADERLGRELVVRGTWCACDSHMVLFLGDLHCLLCHRPSGVTASAVLSTDGSYWYGRTSNQLVWVDF